MFSIYLWIVVPVQAGIRLEDKPPSSPQSTIGHAVGGVAHGVGGLLQKALQVAIDDDGERGGNVAVVR